MSMNPCSGDGICRRTGGVPWSSVRRLRARNAPKQAGRGWGHGVAFQQLDVTHPAPDASATEAELLCDFPDDTASVIKSARRVRGVHPGI
jgi:hypothetical protein